MAMDHVTVAQMVEVQSNRMSPLASLPILGSNAVVMHVSHSASLWHGHARGVADRRT